MYLIFLRTPNLEKAQAKKINQKCNVKSNVNIDFEKKVKEL